MDLKRYADKMMMNANVIWKFAVVPEVLCVIILGAVWSPNQNMTLPNSSQITTVKIPQLRVTGATELESELLREYVYNLSTVTS